MTTATAPYQDILIVLGVAGLVVPILRRFGINSIIGFLLVGLLLSPSLLESISHTVPFIQKFTLSRPGEISALAEYGVVFLMFLIGLEISPQRLLSMKKLVFGFGGLQVLLSTFGLTLLLRNLGFTDREALILGAALSLSSTAIIMQIFADQKRVGTQTAQLSFAALLMQDLAVIPILLLIKISGTGRDAFIATDVAIAFAQAILAVAFIVILGKFALQPFLRLVADTKSSDLFMAAILFISVGAGAVATAAGLSMSLGAFISGLMLAETEYRRAIETMIEPFKGLLLGAFFLLVGLDVSTSALFDHPFRILAIAATLITIKAVIAFILARGFKQNIVTALESALLLGPCGEFAFVIIQSAKSMGLFANPEIENILLAVIISMMLIPLLASLAKKIIDSRQRLSTTAQSEISDVSTDLHSHVIIVGFGRVGSLTASMLSELHINFIVLDSEIGIITEARAKGIQAYYGDASNPEFLRKCGLASARALAVTMDNPARAETIVKMTRLEFPDLKIIARARDERHAIRLYAAGATEAVPETIEASLQLGEALLVETGVPMGLAIASVHERRDGFRKLLGRPNRKAILASQQKSLRDRLPN